MSSGYYGPVIMAFARPQAIGARLELLSGSGVRVVGIVHRVADRSAWEGHAREIHASAELVMKARQNAAHFYEVLTD